MLAALLERNDKSVRSLNRQRERGRWIDSDGERDVGGDGIDLPWPMGEKERQISPLLIRLQQQSETLSSQKEEKHHFSSQEHQTHQNFTH